MQSKDQKTSVNARRDSVATEAMKVAFIHACAKATAAFDKLLFRNCARRSFDCFGDGNDSPALYPRCNAGIDSIGEKVMKGIADQKTSVVIYGGSGSGKTRLSSVFAAALDCSTIVDDWDGVKSLQPGSLALLRARDEVTAKNRSPGALDGTIFMSIQRAALFTLLNFALDRGVVDFGEMR